MGEESKKKFDVIFAESFRTLLEKANSIGVTKDQVVSINKHEGILFLVFYR